MGIKFNEKTGTYTVSFSKRPGKKQVPVSRTRKGVTSTREAQRIYSELVIEVQRKIEEKTVPTWRVILASFIEQCRQLGYSIKTIHSYKTCLEAHTLEAWGRRSIDSITRPEVLTLHKESVGNRTIGHQKYFLKCLRLTFQWAVDAGYLVANPTPKLKFRGGDKIHKVLTEAQVKLFLNKARELNDQWYQAWAFAIYTGLRSGELYALTWDKVDIENRQILVNESWNNKDGFKDTKSGDDRIVEIPPGLLPVVKELKLQSLGMTYVLPRLEQWDRNEQARTLKMFLLGMGLPAVRFHDLRATWATLLLGNGVAPIKVMKMGGWKNIETMMIYARKAGVDIRGSTDCLRLHEPITRKAEVHSLLNRSIS